MDETSTKFAGPIAPGAACSPETGVDPPDQRPASDAQQASQPTAPRRSGEDDRTAQVMETIHVGAAFTTANSARDQKK